MPFIVCVGIVLLIATVIEVSAGFIIGVLSRFRLKYVMAWYHTNRLEKRGKLWRKYARRTSEFGGSVRGISA